MSDRSIKSAERTLAVFEFFSREQDAFTVSRISKALGIPQPSTSMLLRNLTSLGYLEYDRKKRTYAPSIRVALLGSWISQRFGAAGDLASKVQHLHEVFGETAFIGIQNGPNAQYVIAQSSAEPDRLVVSSGQFRPLTLSAMGRALLAQKPEAEAILWVRRCNADAADPAKRVPELAMHEILEHVRKAGFAESHGEVTPGFGAIAVTIPAPMGSLPLALGVGGPLHRLKSRRARIIEHLLEIKSCAGR